MFCHIGQADRAFLLTRPSRDVTGELEEMDTPQFEFLLTRPSRDVTKKVRCHNRQIYISTHTSLAGRDMKNGGHLFNPGNFYSHVPRGT